MKIYRFSAILFSILFFSVVIFSCKQIQQISNTLVNLQKLQFKLENVSNFRVSGIDITNKKSISDFSLTDGLNLANSFKSKKLPADFILNVAAKNPNDGKNKSQSTSASITSFDWKLYIDEKETINGNIASPVEVPGTGQTKIIPLSMGLDLYKFFGDKGYENVLNLAMALGGVNGSAARLKLDAQPTVSTPIGPISYPGRITIINTQFTNP
jgi:hypothetical protein